MVTEPGTLAGQSLLYLECISTLEPSKVEIHYKHFTTNRELKEKVNNTARQ